MKIVVVVQARTGSSRLPKKVLLPLRGKTVLERMLERVQQAHTPFHLVVATTTQPEDDAVVAAARRAGVAVYRGHPTDLLDRHVAAAREVDADVVVKIPSDCPLIDPAAIDEVLGVFLQDPGKYDFVSNLHPATWPDGNDVEVMTRAAIEVAWREATRPFEREHTTPYLWERPERFRVGNVAWSGGGDLSMSHRLTLDYPEDYALLVAVYEALHREGAAAFDVGAILALLERRPDVFGINAKFAGVNWYRHHMGELRTVSAEQTRSVDGRRATGRTGEGR